MRLSLRDIGLWTLSLALLGATIGSMWVMVIDALSPYSTPIELGGDPDFTPGTPGALGGRGGTAVVRLAFVGDIMQHREQAQDDFLQTYQAIQPVFSEYDLVVGNLEFPVDPGEPVGPPPNSAQFNGSRGHLRALALAGVDLVSTANNHAFDMKMSGALSTLELLGEEEMEAFGTGGTEAETDPIVLEIDSIRIAFVGYTFPPNVYVDENRTPQPWPSEWPINDLYFDDWSGRYRDEGTAMFHRHVSVASSEDADFLIAFVHWGEEWRMAPNRHQRLAARDMIEAGFDLVIGSHSHVLNPPEVIDGKLVAYSLGNLVSAFRELELRTSAVLEVQLVKEESGEISVGDFAYRPTLVHGKHHQIHPIPLGADGEERQALSFAERILGEAVVRPFPMEIEH